MVKVINLLTRVLVFILILSALYLSVVFYLHANTMHERTDRGLSNLLGDWAMVVGISAAAMWIARKIYIKVKKRQFPDFNVTQTTLIYLRKHHILLGWTTVFTASAHGIYYLLRYPDKQGQIYTGLFAWGALVLLVGMGLMLDFKIKKRQRARKVRVYHIILATLFMVGMLVHVM